MSDAKGPQRTQEMVDMLRHWQDLERKVIESVSEIMEKTSYPLVRHRSCSHSHCSG